MQCIASCSFAGLRLIRDVLLILNLALLAVLHYRSSVVNKNKKVLVTVLTFYGNVAVSLPKFISYIQVIYSLI